jgi:hypothetical protein
MKIIINERQYKKLILESFEFGDVKIVINVIEVHSKDEYDIMMLYYNFMGDVYKFFMGIKKNFLDKFPLSNDQTSFCDKKIDEYRLAWNTKYNTFKAKIIKYESKSPRIINIMNSYMNNTLNETVNGNGAIRFNPATKTTNIIKLDKVPESQEDGVVYFWNSFLTKEFLLLQPVLLNLPTYVVDLKPNTFNYDEETNKITTNDGKKSTVYTNESDCEKAMKIYEEQLKIYNENEVINKSPAYKEWIKEEMDHWLAWNPGTSPMSVWTKVDKKQFQRTKITAKLTRKDLIKRGWTAEWVNKRFNNQSEFAFTDGGYVGDLFSPVLIKYWNNPYKPSHLFGGEGYIAAALYPKPIKPICDIPKVDKTVSIKVPTEPVKPFQPFIPPPQITTNKTTPNTPIPDKKPTQVTNFVVQWQENGKQKIKLFPTFDEWNNFVNSKPNIPFISKNNNSSRTIANVTYQSNPGLTADGSYVLNGKLIQ